MEERKYVPFFTAWQKALEYLSDADRGAATVAILHYGAYGEDPEKLPKGAAMCAYLMAKPILDSSREKAVAGRSGGKANAKQTESKDEANAKQTESKTQAKSKLKEEEKEEEYKRKNNKKRNGEFCKHGDPLTPIQKEAVICLLADETEEKT